MTYQQVWFHRLNICIWQYIVDLNEQLEKGEEDLQEI